MYLSNLKRPIRPLIARFMGPTWGPSGTDSTHWTPCWPHEPCYLGHLTSRKNGVTSRRNVEQTFSQRDWHWSISKTLCWFWLWYCDIMIIPQITKFLGPTWCPLGCCRPQMDPMLAPWTLLSGTIIEIPGSLTHHSQDFLYLSIPTIGRLPCYHSRLEWMLWIIHFPQWSMAGLFYWCGKSLYWAMVLI